MRRAYHPDILKTRNCPHHRLLYFFCKAARQPVRIYNIFTRLFQRERRDGLTILPESYPSGSSHILCSDLEGNRRIFASREGQYRGPGLTLELSLNTKQRRNTVLRFLDMHAVLHVFTHKIVGRWHRTGHPTVNLTILSPTGEPTICAIMFGLIYTALSTLSCM